MKTKKLLKYLRLCKQGELCKKAFLVTKGTISITRQHKGVDIKLHIDAPALIGHPEVFHQQKYLATSTAETDIEYVELDASVIDNLLDEANPLTRLLLEGLTGYVGQLLDIASYKKPVLYR